MRPLALCFVAAALSCAPVGPAPVPPTPIDLAPPDALPRTATLETALHTSVAAIDPIAEPPRTRHLTPDGRPRFANRLLLEDSPYLRQHAHNPVDWWPWGDAAFEEARRLGRPVLISVGYATCHWCHVMEEESFEDLEIAAFLNAHYVCIKVDREERPDVDAVYMTAVQAITGRGGWPMTIFATPDRAPFYGGTYFPAREGDRGPGRAAFLPLIQLIHERYTGDPARAAASATELSAELKRRMRPARPSDALPGPALFAQLASVYSDRHDPIHGGLSGAPKFPSSLPVRLLLRIHQRTGDPQARQIARLTLDGMATGGMRDQLGGGVHRYSTDAAWLVPHFEKMLYDQALVSLAHLDGHRLTGSEADGQVVRGILDDTLSELRTPEGGFYSALDADSLSELGEAVEGWFYTWTPAELAAVLSEDDARLAAEWFGVTQAGVLEGRSVLHQPHSLADFAARHDTEPQAMQIRLAALSASMESARRLRPPPLRDDKVVAGWNGLMISALAQAGWVLQEARYIEAAAQAGDFIWTHLRVDGRLHRVWTGAAREEAMLEDHAFVIAGFLDLFDATSDPSWLRRALTLTAALETHFADSERGGWYRTPADGEPLLVREKPDHDGAIPAGSSVHLLNLLRLSALTTDPAHTALADAGFRSLGARLVKSPQSLTEAAIALDWRHARVHEVAIVLPEGAEPAAAQPMLDALRAAHNLHHVRVFGDSSQLLAMQAEVPWVQDKVARDGEVTAYVCEGGVCQAPTTAPAELTRLLTVGPPSATP